MSKVPVDMMFQICKVCGKLIGDHSAAEITACLKKADEAVAQKKRWSFRK
jgi:hypothetical protein